VAISVPKAEVSVALLLFTSLAKAGGAPWASAKNASTLTHKSCSVIFFIADFLSLEFSASAVHSFDCPYFTGFLLHLRCQPQTNVQTTNRLIQKGFLKSVQLRMDYM
jgi:hypothetical protein